MANITPSDINLFNFLKKFTYQGDTDPNGKTPLPLDVFFNACCLLKINATLERQKFK